MDLRLLIGVHADMRDEARGYHATVALALP
jgi:hypothetical protein